MESCRVFIFSEGADELPTIHPPKRRKGKGRSSKPVPVVVDVVSPGQDAERLSRDFPLHNWLENKINELNKAGTGIQKKPYSAGVGVGSNSAAVSCLPCHEYLAFSASKKPSDNAGVCQNGPNCTDVSRGKSQARNGENDNLVAANCLPLPCHEGLAVDANEKTSDNTGVCQYTENGANVPCEAPTTDGVNGSSERKSCSPYHAGVAVDANEKPSDNTGFCQYMQNGDNVSCKTPTTDDDNISLRMRCLPDNDSSIGEHDISAPETPVEGQPPYSISAKGPLLTPTLKVVSQTPPTCKPALLQTDESDVVTDTKSMRYTS